MKNRTAVEEALWGLHGKVDRVLARLDHIERRQVRETETLMATIDDLVTQLQAETDAETAIEMLYQGALDKLAADAILAGANQVKMDAAVAQMKSNTDKLVAATIAGTPVVPAP